MSHFSKPPSIYDINAAAERIKPYINITPVLSSSSINEMTGASIYFKCENFQKTGAFKIRGATNALLLASNEEKANGVATHSSGNHGQAIALASKLFNLKAYIVMPENSALPKKEAVAGYGAEIIFCGPTQQDRENAVAKVLSETGAHYVHPYDDYRVITGQATVAKELIEEVSNLNYILAPVGGGGLISGTGLSVNYFMPSIKVIGAEPEGANDAFRSLSSGALKQNGVVNTIADGLRASLSETTFSIIQNTVEDIITVSDHEIVAAMRLVWERMKIIIEPSSAVPLAAIIKQKERFRGQKIGVILTGGNVDLNALPFTNGHF